MNLDEVIAQFKEDAENNRVDLDFSFAEENEQIADWLTQLKEYKQLDADGKLLKLPCKVGDTVYAIIAIHIPWDVGDKANKSYRIDQQKFSLEMLDKIGKKIFLTKDAAEKRLAELKDEEYDKEQISDENDIVQE